MHKHRHHVCLLHSQETPLQATARFLSMYTVFHILIHVISLVPFLSFFHAHDHKHVGDMVIESALINVALHIGMALCLIMHEKVKSKANHN